MRIANMKAGISLALVGLFLSSIALAGPLSDGPPSGSIDSCIAEIRENADYSGASRVQHRLKEIGHRSLAYKFRITTAVYDETGEDVIREYSTKCIVYGNDAPVFFKIEATTDDA